MEIKPDEVEEVKIIGKLHDDDVKLVKTKGGFYVAVGKKKKESNKADALAAGSHQALVAYQVEKIHGNSFQPTISKSEKDRLPEVEDMTKILPDQAINSGLELFVLEKYNHIDFVFCKHNIELAKYETSYEKDILKIKNYNFKGFISPNKFVSEAIAYAMQKKMKDLGLDKIERKNS
jgi:hypothetical protein